MTDTPTNTHGGYREGAGRPAGAKNKKAASTWIVQVRVDAELEQRIKDEAAARDMTPAALCRTLIEQGLK